MIKNETEKDLSTRTNEVYSDWSEYCYKNKYQIFIT